jgi:3-methyladenine DNA glycosylase/8-oxoguanine DNA glycosylase
MGKFLRERQCEKSLLGGDAKALERRSEDWRPWRAYAAMYLWHQGAGNREQAEGERQEPRDKRQKPTAER